MSKIWVAIWAIYSLFNSALAKVSTRDCYVGSPPQCNNSLASDPTCRGLEVTTADGWKRMDCDYVVYNIPTTRRNTKKWLVIHAGGCDTYTEDLGDFFAPDMGLNIFGLRPCGGFADSLCASQHDYDICTMIHIPWLLPALHPTNTPYGLGLNPPALVDIFHTPGSNLLFLHEYGDTNSSYNWFSADGCDATSKPLYICLAAIDPDYTNKFSAIKRTLENGISNTPGFPCRLEVVDSMPYAGNQDPAIPCTGILREYNDPAKVGGDPSGAPNWAWEMPEFMTRAIQLATQVEPEGVIVNAFRTAINIALCKQFDDPNDANCSDDDMID
ncbi:hypothetical protein BGZ63DRAFT_444589 [Mariannaea sp. PMI_226]|nr:hypothetical protein BGZ63DRAFT_444589 [Mariannaea sp. PMI_226]